MGYQFTIHDDLRLVYKKVWGEYGDAESTESHAEWDAMCQASPEIGDFNEFHDLTEVTGYHVSLEQIRLLADRYEAEWETGRHQPKRLAYVVPSAVAFGTGRVYGALISMTLLTFRVFSSLDDAADWMGLDRAQRRKIWEPPR